jgi:hypothetical protein
MTITAPPEPSGGAFLHLNTSSPTGTPPSSNDATDNRWFPCSLLLAGRRRSPTVSQRPRHRYAAGFHCDLTRRPWYTALKFSPRLNPARRPRPTQIRQIRVGVKVEGRNNASSSHTPLRHARRTRTIWQYWPVPASSGLLPPSPAPLGSGCHQLRPPATTGKGQCVIAGLLAVFPAWRPML